jgi:CBS domain-containing protein
MQVRDIMTQPAYTIQQGAPAEQAAELMAIYNVGALAVCDGERIVGIVTDRDLVVQCMATHRSPKVVAVRSIMTRELVVAEPSDPVQEVAGLMGRHGVHRVPVVQNERPIGMLSADDIARFYDDDVAIIELERSLASYIGAPLPLT